VESKPETGCATFVNGRHLGVTPFRLDRAAEGEYRVQVECGRAPGRVHLVHLGEKPVELTVDFELDRALHSEGRIALVYDSLHEAKRLAKQHGVEVARHVRAEELVLVSVADEHAELSRLSVAQAAVLGRSHVPWSQTQNRENPELGRAIDALLEGRIEEVPDTLVADAPQAPARTTLAQEPQLLPPPETARAAESGALPRRVRRMRSAAAALAAVGAGLFVAGITFEHQRERADQKLAGLVPGEDDSAVADAQEDYDRGEKLRWLGTGGGALLGASVPLLRVDVSRAVPWWSYLLGAAGAAFATWGVVELAKNGDCEEPLTAGGCAKQRESSGKGGLLLAGAFPLLVFPIDHLIEFRLRRRADGKRLSREAHEP
jgi:hypothetical protein